MQKSISAVGAKFFKAFGSYKSKSHIENILQKNSNL
ncbi:hypothetical protein BH10BAC1_BH10BAC1_14620 [soil metagenome]